MIDFLYRLTYTQRVRRRNEEYAVCSDLLGLSWKVRKDLLQKLALESEGLNLFDAHVEVLALLLVHNVVIADKRAIAQVLNQSVLSTLSAKAKAHANSALHDEGEQINQLQKKYISGTSSSSSYISSSSSKNLGISPNAIRNHK